ncbi:MAG: hypothetical protein ABI670_13250 [Chloroflexota bacterium]
MIYALVTLILTALVCYLLGFTSRGARSARIVAVTGVLASLAVALQQEGLQGGGMDGAAIPWPDFMSRLGTSFYRSDLLAASIGAWCIAVGALCLLRIGDGNRSPSQLAAATLAIAALYSLAHTTDLRAFAAHLLLLAFLTWTYLPSSAEGALITRQRAAQTLGALSLLGAVLIIGRTTGNIYGLESLSLAALTLWPLVLVLLFVVFWLGLAPFTGWSALPGDEGESKGALLQGLILGVPALLILLRLQALISSQALAGSVPPDWIWFTTALTWLGGITTLTAGAAVVVWAGTSRWSGALTAYTLGLTVWGLGLDTPTGRFAALVVLLSYGLGRAALDLSAGQYDWLSRLTLGLSLVFAPLTVGFTGVWLLTSAIIETGHTTLALVLIGAAILAAVGTAIHLVSVATRQPTDVSPGRRYGGLLALGLSALLVIGGALPGLWLPYISSIADIAGGTANLDVTWATVQSGDLFAPFPLLAFAAAIIGLLGFVLRTWAKSTTTPGSALLPTALDRLQKARQPVSTPQPLLSNPPPAVWWLSLVWIERGVFGFGALLARAGSRLGILLARLEGRYYLPLALILALLIVLAVTR